VAFDLEMFIADCLAVDLDRILAGLRASGYLFEAD
jgi:hypothetical protein